MRRDRRIVVMSALRDGQLRQLAFYLRDVVYHHPEKLLIEHKARRIARGLFEMFIREPRLLPRVTQERLQTADVHRVVCDYVSGMTDRFALDLYSRMFESYEFGYGGDATS
jgi:dGTPase